MSLLPDELVVQALRDAGLGDVADLLEERLAEDAPPADEPPADEPKAKASLGARLRAAAG